MTAGNLADLVRRAADRFPAKAALLYQDQSVTWGEFEDQVSRAAGALASLDLAPGDRVAIALGNTPAFPVCYFGALRAGLVAVPVNPASTSAELRHVLGDSGAIAVVGQRPFATLASELAAHLLELRHVIVVGDASPAPAGTLLLEELVESARPLESPQGGSEDLALLIYTSGTSGRPRGAMLSHRALLANLEQCSRIEPPVMSDDDVVLVVLPLFHIYGLNAALGMVAYHGATGVLVERFDPVDTLAIMRRHHVSNVVGAPPMYVAWSLLPDVGDAFADVRLAVSGAAPLPAQALTRFLDATGHHVFEGYGLTETAPVLTSTLMSAVAKPMSIGRAIPGVELRLLNDSGGLAQEDDPGEIAVRGDNLFSGYWPDGAGGPDDSGWFRTGDVAYSDDDGDLSIVDRRRELILVSGFNVYPREVEDVLARHPGIEEAAVIGIAHPYTGEAVKAVVVRRPGVQLTADDVIAHCALSLAAFKCPTTVEFAAGLPHSATGKTAKGRLRESAGGS
ncbi:MAG: AMP-binding protein [Actinomycetota bacterium]